MIRHLFIFALLAICSVGCKQDSIVGSGLLDDEKFDVQYTEDIVLQSSVIEGDPLITYRVRDDDNILSSSFFCLGQIDEPIFGKKDASVFVELGFTESPIGTGPNFVGGTLDSMVIILQYDSLSAYGSKDVMHHLKFFSLSEDFTGVDTIFGNVVPNHVPKVIATKAFVPAYRDSLTITSPVDTSDLRIPPQIRVRLDNAWAQQWFEDTTLHKDLASQRNFTKGFYITDNPDGSSLLGLDLRSYSNSNRVLAYYTDKDGKKSTYAFPFAIRKGQIVSTDKSGSLIQSVYDGTAASNEIFGVESHNGYEAKITFEDLSILKDKVINHAVLKVYQAQLPQDDLEKYPGILQITGQEISNTGDRQFIRDVRDLLLIPSPLTSGFGGVIVTDDGPPYYEFIITKKLHELIETTDKSDDFIILGNQSRSQSPRRSIFYGPKSTVTPMKLEVTYTNK